MIYFNYRNTRLKSGLNIRLNLSGFSIDYITADFSLNDMFTRYSFLLRWYTPGMGFALHRRACKTTACGYIPYWCSED